MCGYALSETEFLATIVVEELALIVEMEAVAERMLYLPMERMSHHGTPFALALDALLVNRPRGMGLDNHEVGLIAGTYKTSFADFEQKGRMVAHQFYHTLDGKNACIDKLEHGHQRELNHRHARNSLGCTTLLLGEKMGGMVGANGGDAPFEKGFAKGIAVGTGLDGGIALDKCAQTTIVFIAEEEMAHRCLGCDMRVAAKELQLALSGEMSHMQPRTVLRGHGNGTLC